MEVMNFQETANPGATAPEEERRYSWLKPWLFLVSSLVIKTAFLTIFVVVLLHGSDGQYKTLLQNSTEWCCVPNISADKIPQLLIWFPKLAECTSSFCTVEGWVRCPKGWKRFQKSCYYLSRDKMSWDESEQNCSSMGSHLAVINSREEQEFLFNLGKEKADNSYETKYYIGLTSYRNGEWQWVDQTPYEKTATFWKPGEPNLLFAERCAAIHVKGNRDSNTYSNWNNILCFTSCYRICELAVKFV